MAIYTLDDLRAAAPAELKNLSAEDLVRDFSYRKGVPFEQEAEYFGIKPRGLLGAMATQAAGGAVVDLPRMVGQAAQYLGADEFGRGLVAGAEQRERFYTPDLRGRNVVGEAVTMGARALAPVAATLPLGLVPGGQFAAPAAAAGLFGLSSAQETYEKLLRQGVSEPEAREASYGVGAIQGLGEAAATYTGARLLRPAMAAVRKAPTTARIAAEATETGVGRPFLKGMLTNLAVQPTTEVAQDLGTAYTEEAYGATPEDKWEIARQSALGGAGLTLLLGPLALNGAVRRSQNAARLKEALDPASGVDPAYRAAAIDLITTEARRQGVGDADIGRWVDEQLLAEETLTQQLAAQEQARRAAEAPPAPPAAPVGLSRPLPDLEGMDLMQTSGLSASQAMLAEQEGDLTALERLDLEMRAKTTQEEEDRRRLAYNPLGSIGPEQGFVGPVRGPAFSDLRQQLTALQAQAPSVTPPIDLMQPAGARISAATELYQPAPTLQALAEEEAAGAPPEAPPVTAAATRPVETRRSETPTLNVVAYDATSKDGTPAELVVQRNKKTNAVQGVYASTPGGKKRIATLSAEQRKALPPTASDSEVLAQAFPGQFQLRIPVTPPAEAEALAQTPTTLPQEGAPGTIAAQSVADQTASLPGVSPVAAGLPPAPVAGGLSTQDLGTPKPTEAPKAPKAPKAAAPAEDPFTAEDRAKLAQDLGNLEATITSTPGAAKGKLSLPQSVLAGLARMVRTTKTMPPVAYVPKTASEVDSAATQQYGEQMGRIRDAANKVIDAANTLFNFESNLPPTEKRAAFQRKGMPKLTEAQKDEIAAAEAGVEVGKLAEKRALLLNAINELRAAAGSDVNVEAVVAVTKGAIQKAQQRSQAAAKAKMETSRDALLSRAWAMYKDGVLATPEAVDVVRGREVRLSTESAARGAETQPLVQAATEGYARRVIAEPKQKAGESDADFAARQQKFAKTKEALTEKGLSGMLAYLQRHGTGFERLLASAVGRALRNEKRKAPTIKWLTEGEKSFYDPKTDTVGLHETESPEVLLHEALHASLQWFVYQNPTIAEVVRLEAALKSVLDYKGTVPPQAQAVIDVLRSKYGEGKTKQQKLDAVLELVSYGTTLKDFRDLLKRIPSTAETEGFFAGIKALWKRITALVQKALGVSNTMANDVLDSTVALLEQAAAETEVVMAPEASTLEAAVASNKAVRDAVGMDAKDFRDFGKRVVPPMLSTKFVFDLFGWDKNVAAKVSAASSKLAERIRKDFPMAERMAIYINSRFSAGQRASEAMEQSKFDRSVGYQQMEELLKHISMRPREQFQAVIDYLDGNKKALDALPDARNLRRMADDMKKWFDKYVDDLSAADQRFFRTTKFSQALLYPKTTEQIASSTFGMRKISEVMGLEHRNEATIEGFKQFMENLRGEVDLDARFYMLTQNIDGKGAQPAGFINIERFNRDGAPKGLSVDTSKQWWLSTYTRDKNYKFSASMTAQQALAQDKADQLANAMRNTMAALANNYAAKRFSEAMTQLGYEDGKPTAQAVVFDSVDAINSTFGIKVRDDQVLRVSGEMSRSAAVRSEYRRSGTWVKLPESDNYGPLAGKYVHGPVWTAMVDMMDRQPLVQLRAYNNIMRWFKKSKTVYNPATHLTNVASNVTLAMLHDIPMSTIGKAAALYAKYEVSPKSLTDNEIELLAAFRNSGALLGDYSSSEVKQALYDAWKANMSPDNDTSLIRRMTGFAGYEKAKSSALVKLAGKGAEQLDKVAMEAYAAEDNIFRLAAFLTKAADLQTMRGEAAASEQTMRDAGQFAKEAFLDYDIDSKAVRVLRQSVMPFISWTYAITPVLARIALHQPWKLANVLMAYYLLERGMALMGGDDDEEQRKVGPEYVRDRMWGFGPYMHVRIPFLGNDQNPVYYRLGDYFPMATLFKSLPNGPAGQSWIPSAITPSGPFVSAIVGLVAGVDPYTGKGIHEATDTDLDKLWNSTKYAYDIAMPPAVSSRNLARAGDVLSGTTGVTGALPSGYVFARMMGLKLYDYNVDESQAMQEFAAARIEREFKMAMTKAKREEMRKGVPDYAALDEELAELERRMEERIAAARGGEIE